MLERLAGNDALKSALSTALHAGHLPHAILLIGEPGCGTGFAARCLAADYLYPQGGAHAEAVLKKADSECITLRGEGPSGQIRVDTVRDMRAAIQRSALSTDATGRVMFIYDAQNLNDASANALLKTIEEPPEGALFLFTAISAATVLPTIRSRCAAYTVAPVPTAEAAALLQRFGLPAATAEEYAFLYEGHIGTAMQTFRDAAAKQTLAAAKQLCGYSVNKDAYRALMQLTKLDRDREGLISLIQQLEQLCSAVLRRPAYGVQQCGGLTPAGAAHILPLCADVRKSVAANINLRILIAAFSAQLTL